MGVLLTPIIGKETTPLESLRPLPCIGKNEEEIANYESEFKEHATKWGEILERNGERMRNVRGQNQNQNDAKDDSKDAKDGDSKDAKNDPEVKKHERRSGRST